MKSLLILTALIELGAGSALIGVPSTAIRLLVGERIEIPAALTVARIGGAGLLSLGIACWFARNDSRGGAVRGLVAAMLLYNVAVVAILLWAALGFGLHGTLLWPGVVLHTLMAFGCVACPVQCAGITSDVPRTAISKSSTANKE